MSSSSPGLQISSPRLKICSLGLMKDMPEISIHMKLLYMYSPMQYTNADKGKITEPRDTHGNGIEIKYSFWFLPFPLLLLLFLELSENKSSSSSSVELADDVFLLVLRFLNLPPSSMIFKNIHLTVFSFTFSLFNMQCVGLGSFESFILLYQKYHDRRHQEAFQMFLPHCKPSRKVTTIRTQSTIYSTHKPERW